MRQRTIALIALLIIIGGLAGAYWYNQSREALAGVEGRLTSEISKALGADITVGKIELASLNKINLFAVVVRDDTGEAVASTDKVTVSFSPLSLLVGDAAVTAVNELVFDKPRINLVRRPEGKWNVEAILERTRSGESAFSGKIFVVNGVLEVKTSEAGWTFDNINGSLNFVHKPDIAVNINANYGAAPLELSGRVTQQGSSYLELKAASLTLDDLNPLIKSQYPQLQTLSGKVTGLDVSLSFNKGIVSYAGEARLDGIGFDLAGTPVRDAKGFVIFSDKYINFYSASLKVAEQEAHFSGKVTIDASEPVFNLQVKTDMFDLAKVFPNAPLKGPLSFNGTVAGTVSNPSIKGQVGQKEGELAGYYVQDVKANISLNDNILTINNFEAGAFGGKVSGAGTIDTAANSFNMKIFARAVELGSLPEMGVNITGQGDIDLNIDGAGSVDSATVVANVKAHSGSLAQVPFAGLSCGIAKSGGHIDVSYLTVDFAPGSITASGTIDDNVLNLKVFGQGVPLANLAALDGNLLLSGSADFEGTVAGTADSPILTVKFNAYNGECYYQPFTLAHGSLSVTKTTVALQDLEAINGVTRHQVKGSIGLSGRREFDLAITTSKARAENITRLIMPNEKITGNIDNEVKITGPFDEAVIEGKVKLTEGSYRGYLVSSAEGKYRRQGGKTILSDCVIESLNAGIKLDGSITADNSLDINIAAKDVDIAKLSFNYPYPVAGQANFTGKLTGTANLPVFTGEISAKTLSLNNKELQGINGQININGKQINIPSFSFVQKAGKYTFAGGFNIDSGAISGDLNAENGSMADLLAILNVPVKDFDGRLNGRITVQGTANKPSISLVGTLTNGKVKNYPLDTIEVDVAFENDVVKINRFYAKQGNGVLAARGTAALQGPLNLEVGGRDIDAGLLTTWFDSTINTRGTLNFAAQVTGTSAMPHASVSLEIKGGGVANATFDSLFGLFVLDNNNIAVNQLMLVKGPYKASAYGTIPLAALSAKGRKSATAADEMDLKLRLDKANLSILPLLTKEVSWATGETIGELRITGTLAQPLLYGGISVSDGTVKLASLADPIQKVGVDIKFDGDKINIESFDGSMGGGTYRLTGSALLNGLEIEGYTMALVIDKLGINHKYFKGPLNANLMLTRTNGRPLLSGKISTENVMINIPSVPELGLSNSNLALDVEVIAGKKVRLYNPYMYDLLVDGKVKFAGTTRRPDVSGKLEVIRGTVNYLRTQFKVTSGAAEFTQFRSFMPVLRLNAETKLESAKVYLSVSGQPDAMQFHLTSEPTMSQQEIFTLLTLRSRYFDKSASNSNLRDNGLGREEVLGLLQAGMQMTFLTEAETAFRNALNLNDFRLVRGEQTWDMIVPMREIDINNQYYSLAISKYVNDRLLLGYSIGVDHQGHTISFRYDLNRRVSLTGLQDEQNRFRFGIETRFHF